jgi:hypothetical protein
MNSSSEVGVIIGGTFSLLDYTNSLQIGCRAVDRVWLTDLILDTYLVAPPDRRLGQGLTLVVNDSKVLILSSELTLWLVLVRLDLDAFSL